MEQRCRGTIAAGFVALLCLPAAARAADDLTRLQDLVEAQGRQIERLTSELERVRTEQQQSEDRVLALEDERAAAGPQGDVTADYVDQRILAYENRDESRFFLSGYGSATYDNPNGSETSSFEVGFNPIFQYRLRDDVYFNAELEFELDDGETKVELEFATLDYLVNDWLALSAGKFLTPFNAFGPRLHPAWINKMVSRPVIYAKPGGVIPVISDVGIMASGGARLWDDDSKFNYALYVTNGPIASAEPALDFDNTRDENDNKTVGGRLGFLPIPNLEIGVSGMAGRSKGGGGSWNLVGADASFWYRGLDLLGEYVRLDTDQSKWGYYLQAAYRLANVLHGGDEWSRTLGRFEPVLRWGETRGFSPDNRQQLALGLNYWLYESVPLKLTYELNSKTVDDDRLLLQFAFGF